MTMMKTVLAGVLLVVTVAAIPARAQTLAEDPAPAASVEDVIVTARRSGAPM